MTLAVDPAPAPFTALDLLAQVRAERAERDACDVRILLHAVDWANRHVVGPAEAEEPQVSHLEGKPSRSWEFFERLGLPELTWDAGASFAAALGLSTASGDRLLRDALILSVRLPRVFACVVAGKVPVWRARRVAEAAVGAPRDVTSYLDQEVAPVITTIGVTGLDRIIDNAMLAMYPEEREMAQLEALDARYVTLHEETINDTGVAEMSIRADFADLAAFDDTVGEVAARLGREGEDGEHESLDVRRAMAVGVLADPERAAAMLAVDDAIGAKASSRRRGQLRFVAHLSEANLLGLDPVALDATGRGSLMDVFSRWAGRPDLTVQVQPIRHCGGCPDCSHEAGHTGIHVYAPSASDRAVVETRDRGCQFPFCDRPAARCDLDHCQPFDHDHPEAGGPTCPCNLAPLCRRHHRLKTHAGWTYVIVEPGVHLWHDRYGQSFLRTRDGTAELTPRQPQPMRPGQ